MEYLVHYGVKGMKWGVRRYRSGRISFAKRQRDMVCRCLVE